MMGAATEQLANQALAALQGIINTAIQVGDFVKGQLPQVVHELLVYKTVVYSLQIAFGAACLAGIPLLLKFVVPRYKAASRDGRDLDIGYIFLGILGTLVLFIVGFVNLTEIFNLIEIVVAPRVWLIEYVRHLAA
jgi:hypothetical protein